MKIRMGFISNSSTSSFVLLGICTDDTEEVANILKLTKEEIQNRIDKDGDLGYSAINDFDVVYDYQDRNFYIGTAYSRGQGFWGGEKIKLDNLVNLKNLKPYNKLKSMGYSPDLYIGEYGE